MMDVMQIAGGGYALLGGLTLLCVLTAGWAVRERNERRRLGAENATLKSMVETDDLTSARSRRFMRSIFEQEDQSGQNALIFVDLDNFKSVNDGYGHKAGDALMRRIADDLVASAQAGEIVFRIGGDEFGIYLRDTTLEVAILRAQEYRRVVAQASITVDGVVVGRTSSVGVARIEAGQDFVGALYYADEAQYAAKSAGGNAVRANEGETLRSMIARRTGPRAEEVAKAISSNEVRYHVQPIFDTRVGCPIGVEALLRWHRPDGRLMMPHQFLNVMTGSHNIEMQPPLARARHVLDAVAAVHDHMFCAFNISSGLLDADVDDEEAWVAGLLADLDPSRTVFEIVERAVFRNPGTAKALLHLLRKRGVRVALDDFGTGMSNLERLQELDVDIVKIDRRFIRGIDTGGGADIGILRALLDMAKDMQFGIIAEGVETQAELDTLNGIGIWIAQGFLLGRPDTVENWTAAFATGDVPKATRQSVP